ncbi:polygalacturonase QRT3-like, partial [Phalaenopsis equestris]|uniref:polygalacturonase QRT3-like n=1 Tax=Phalaenopsis equestris TaxID=78828 RepID=UPI0009E580BC
LDGNYRSGGIAVVDSLRTLIDGCYIVHFSTDGIWIKDGHETFITNSFLGQHITAGSDPGERNFSGNAIRLFANDNTVADVVIFSAAIGILVAGQANLIAGVHCYNKATGFGGTGIYLKLPGLTQNRIVNCYLDYTGIVSEDPVQLLVSGSFFLGDANVVLKSVNGVMNGVAVVDNTFAGSGNGVEIVGLDETGGAFRTVDQVVVGRNSVKGMTVRSTAATAAKEGNGTVWTVDFSRVLLIPNRIDQVQYTMQTGSGFPNHALRNVSGNQVVIESDRAVQGTVYVAVSQCESSMA